MRLPPPVATSSDAVASARNIPAFSRFLRAAALCNATGIDFTDVANDAPGASKDGVRVLRNPRRHPARARAGGVALDLVRLEDADALLRHEVLRDGLLLWGDPDLHCELRAYAYRDFVDSADLFALEEALSRKKLARIREKLGAQT